MHHSAWTLAAVCVASVRPACQWAEHFDSVEARGCSVRRSVRSGLRTRRMSHIVRLQLASISGERVAHMQRTIGANAHRLHVATADFPQDSIELSVAMLVEIAAHPPPALSPCADHDDALAQLTTLASSCADLPAESCRTRLKAALREQPRCREDCRWLENVSVSVMCPQSCQALRAC